jgi:hypothetical protein
VPDDDSGDQQALTKNQRHEDLAVTDVDACGIANLFHGTELRSSDCVNLQPSGFVRNG